MAAFVFEGEVESLSQRQLQLVSEVLQKRGLKDNKVLIETLGKAGDNFIANVKRIIVTLENGEVFRMVAKIAPTNEFARIQGGTVELFANECLMYNEVFPKFADLQQAAGLSKEETFRFPICYGTLMEPMNEMLLLEDLTESNLEMLDRFRPLTNESVRQVLKNFALLHSLSYALRKKEPATFDSYKEKFVNFIELMSAAPEFQYFLIGLEEDTVEMLENEKYKKACLGSVSQVAELTTKSNKYDSNMKYAVLLHGDAWANNFMFRLENNISVDAILIDYQLSNVGNPVCDVQYMIFSSTDYSTRHQHYNDWIDYYHSELEKSLANFGLKASYIYNRDQLDADLRRYSRLIFAASVLRYSVLIQNAEDASKIKEAMENNFDFNEIKEALTASNMDMASGALYKKKIADLVESYYELGYLS